MRRLCRGSWLEIGRVCRGMRRFFCGSFRRLLRRLIGGRKGRNLARLGRRGWRLCWQRSWDGSGRVTRANVKGVGVPLRCVNARESSVTVISARGGRCARALQADCAQAVGASAGSCAGNGSCARRGRAVQTFGQTQRRARRRAALHRRVVAVHGAGLGRGRLRRAAHCSGAVATTPPLEVMRSVGHRGEERQRQQRQPRKQRQSRRLHCSRPFRHRDQHRALPASRRRVGGSRSAAKSGRTTRLLSENPQNLADL